MGIMFNKKQVQRFSIRKLTVGAASVLIGVAFLSMSNTNEVKADALANAQEQVQTEKVENTEKQSNETKDVDNISNGAQASSEQAPQAEKQNGGGTRGPF